MTPGARTIGLTLVAAALVLACVDIPTGSDDLLSVRLNPLPFPAVVAGDTLRDASGAAAPLSVTAFNFRGDTISNPPVRFRALDGRIKVDSVTGFVTGDTASVQASRVLATLDGFTGIITVPVTLRPDSVTGANARDSLAYSLADTAANTSSEMGVRVLHGFGADTAVRSFLVTFTFVSEDDTLFARMIDGSGRRSTADTTDASGVAGRRIRIDVARLASPVDSVEMQATVLYRGQHVRGSPMRLVLNLKPR